MQRFPQRAVTFQGGIVQYQLLWIPEEEAPISELSKSEQLRLANIKDPKHHHQKSWSFVFTQQYVGDVMRPLYKKPYAKNGKRFSVSHTDNLYAIAWSDDGEVGIDIERANPNVKWETIAKRFLNYDDVEVRKSDVSTFYTEWTKKEAIHKAFGLSIFKRPTGYLEESIQSIEMPDGFHGAIALIT